MHPTLSRRTLLGAAAATPFAAALAACGTEPPEDRPHDHVTFITNFGTLGRDSYAYVAAEKGFFDALGITVTIEPGAGGANYVTLAAAGTHAFAAVDSSGALIRYANLDQDFRIISAVHQLPPIGIVALANTGITTPQNLEGRTVGLAAESISEILWPHWATLAEIDLDRVRTEATNPATQTAEFVAGAYDAMALFAFGTPGVEAAAGADTVFLPWSNELPELYGSCIITTAELAERNPDLVDRFNSALLQGLVYAVENPDEAAAIMAELIPDQAGSEEANAAELRLMASYIRPDGDQPVGYMDPARVARSVGVLQSIGALNPATGLAVDQQAIAWQHVPGAAA